MWTLLLMLALFSPLLVLSVDAETTNTSPGAGTDGTTVYGNYGAMDEIIVDTVEPTFDGFDSPNDMAFLFAGIALLATLGLGVINTSD